MAAKSNLYQGIFDLVDKALHNYVQQGSERLIHFLVPLFSSLMIIWLAIWGYALMTGRSEAPLQEGFYRILRIGFILALGLTVGRYNQTVVTFLSDAPQTIASIVSGGHSMDAAHLLDQLFSQVFQLADNAWKQGGVMNGNFGMYFIAVAVLLIGSCLTLLVAFFILLSKVMVSILLAIGPAFFVLLLFQATQRFFESWLGMVLNFGFVLLLGVTSGQLMVSVANSYLHKIASNHSTMTTLSDSSMLCIVLGLCILVMKQIPAMASALGGGVAIAANGAIANSLHSLRPTTLRNQYRMLRRDMNYTGQALATPIKPLGVGYHAYQKRFGGNSISGRANP
ncbi:type IV secretion system protein [Parashewanella spongiae]|uniref:Type IV secretion system protein n=1 Tax=Parashewanella spongiae TaxID=342950 RepID=A0A3A6U053_9GAMM|nr:type IV secretion system protein [Parashewanella spongiae]MCL1079448.1 type IV secretion system protein [Parashewanella spongiae]RJY07560.1 type IV secretion system protein [Parashewanella spongiae]